MPHHVTGHVPTSLHEEGVRKSRVVMAIHLGFSFWKRRQELLIAALIGTITANIGGATIYNFLCI